jgi:hypothetical protein
MEEPKQIQEQKPKRPQLLTILCIVTFIGSGLSALAFLWLSVFYDIGIKMMETVYADMPETAFLLQAPYEFFVISFFLYAFSVVGAIFMWNLRKLGFHIYTIAQLSYLVIPYLYFGGEGSSILSVFLTALFVYLYARNLPYMK